MTATQLSLTDCPARVHDPDTSKASAVEDRSNDRALVLDAIHRMGGRGTADSVTAWLGENGHDRQRNCVSSRISQLVRRGRLRDSGDRTTGATGRPVTIWEMS